MITLLTDFGTADYFVAAVKGVMLSLNPQATIVDLTHEVPAQDIACGAFTLGACWHEFPRGTIHLAVVDPGVGSERRVIVVEADGHCFVGPDNGIFSYVYAREPQARVHHVTSTRLFRHPLSATFHGRDVFAPLAAHLSLGLSPATLGPVIADYERFNLPAPVPDEASQTITGEIIHIDRFGNCVTSLTERELRLTTLNENTRLSINDYHIERFSTHYAQSSMADQLFAYPGSAGYWEVAVWQDSAARKLNAQRGMKIMLKYWSASGPPA